MNRIQNTGFFPMLVSAPIMCICYAPGAAAGPALITHACSLIDDVPMSMIGNTGKNDRIDHTDGISFLWRGAGTWSCHIPEAWRCFFWRSRQAPVTTMGQSAPGTSGGGFAITGGSSGLLLDQLVVMNENEPFRFFQKRTKEWPYKR